MPSSTISELPKDISQAETRAFSIYQIDAMTPGGITI